MLPKSFPHALGQSWDSKHPNSGSGKSDFLIGQSIVPVSLHGKIINRLQFDLI